MSKLRFKRSRRRVEEGEEEREERWAEEEDLAADPERFFRESLFDAMADDEGADFWSSYYHQPVVLPRPAEMDAMDDDAYAKYVREEMWKRKHPPEQPAKRTRTTTHGKQRRHHHSHREGERWSVYLEDMANPTKIPWPVQSGAERDVTADNVASFLCTAPGDRMVTLRKMKVFWHPDHAKRRWGGLITDAALAHVTQISQVVNALCDDDLR